MMCFFCNPHLLWMTVMSRIWFIADLNCFRKQFKSFFLYFSTVSSNFSTHFMHKLGMILKQIWSYCWILRTKTIKKKKINTFTFLAYHWSSCLPLKLTINWSSSEMMSWKEHQTTGHLKWDNKTEINHSVRLFTFSDSISWTCLQLHFILFS